MYFIIKNSRVFEGHGYKGSSSNYVEMKFEKKEDAEKAKTELEKINLVGWQVIEVILLDIALAEKVEVYLFSQHDKKLYLCRIENTAKGLIADTSKLLNGVHVESFKEKFYMPNL